MKISKNKCHYFFSRRVQTLLLLSFSLVIFGACQKPKESKVGPVDPMVDKGRAVYLSTCIACHNPDPTQNGALGPAVQGSSIELLEARILHAKYPEGYKPKRETAQMPAFPELKNEIPALHAFLNSATN